MHKCWVANNDKQKGLRSNPAWWEAWINWNSQQTSGYARTSHAATHGQRTKHTRLFIVITTQWRLDQHAKTGQNSISLQCQLQVHTSNKQQSYFTIFLSVYFLMETPQSDSMSPHTQTFSQQSNILCQYVSSNIHAQLHTHHNNSFSKTLTNLWTFELLRPQSTKNVCKMQMLCI